MTNAFASDSADLLQAGPTDLIPKSSRRRERARFQTTMTFVDRPYGLLFSKAFLLDVGGKSLRSSQ